MKTLKNYLKMALIGIIIVSTGVAIKASDSDTFGENVAKAVLLHWSPKPEHIKTAQNYDYSDYNQDNEDEENDNNAHDWFVD